MAKPSEEQFASFGEAIDNVKEKSIKRLADWVAVQSVSSDVTKRGETIRMMEVALAEYTELGADVWLADNPNKHEMTPDGEKIPLPPIILGKYPKNFDSNKKTILLYGHLDVQPARLSDGWDSEPFVLDERNGKLFGRGSTDDKGPVLGWLIALEEIKKLEIDLPVNLKLCFEGMEESGSVGLDELIDSNPDNFFYPGIDGTCISDNYWLGTTKPCLTYGLRGICYFGVCVECCKNDLHSGCYGGTVHEAMTDLIKIMGSLVDNRGKILIDGINETVDPITDEERKIYTNIDFCINEYADSIKGSLIYNNKEETLQARWRNPSLSLHGIEGAFYNAGEKTVIPRRVIGKFSIRLVPSMDEVKTIDLVTAHIEKMKTELNTPNKIWMQKVHGAKPWYGDPNGFLFEAGKDATKRIYKMDPDLTREGGSIPVTLSFQNATKNPCILLPMGAGDHGAHSQNENIDIRNYIEGTKLLGAFLMEIGGR